MALGCQVGHWQALSSDEQPGTLFMFEVVKKNKSRFLRARSERKLGLHLFADLTHEFSASV